MLKTIKILYIPKKITYYSPFLKPQQFHLSIYPIFQFRVSSFKSSFCEPSWRHNAPAAGWFNCEPSGTWPRPFRICLWVLDPLWPLAQSMWFFFLLRLSIYWCSSSLRRSRHRNALVCWECHGFISNLIRPSSGKLVTNLHLV